MAGDQSRTVVWGSRLAFLALIVLLLSVTGLRWHLVAFRTPLLGIAVAGLVGIVALLVTLFGFISVARGHKSGLSTALVAAVMAIIAATPLTVSFFKMRGVPAIHDITTDLTNPPQFSAVVALRGDGSNPLDRKVPADLAALQQKAYPDLAPMEVNIPPGKVFEAAREVVHDMGWTVDAATPETGMIEATATTPLLRFMDDVAIRITETDHGSRVDMRSVSRVGKSDLGTNAARIFKFETALMQKIAEDEVDTE
jgi:uncharacterized protein (DUF1499 family)